MTTITPETYPTEWDLSRRNRRADITPYIGTLAQCPACRQVRSLGPTGHPDYTLTCVDCQR